MEASYDQPRWHIKKQRHYFVNKGLSSENYDFSTSHVWMWELDHKENWAPKNWCLWIVVLEKTLESPLNSKAIQPIHPKGNQSWIFIGRTNAEAEAPVLWLPDRKNWLIWKDPDAGNNWRQEEKGKTEDEMVGWHQWLPGPEFDSTPEVGDGQGGLECCSPWGHRVGHNQVTEQNWVLSCMFSALPPTFFLYVASLWSDFLIISICFILWRKVYDLFKEVICQFDRV